MTDKRFVWMAAGLMLGLCIAYVWPHEPALATATDRSSKFGLATCPISPGFAGSGELEGLFVLDYLTGRLSGAVLNPKFGKFTNFYFRSVAADFQVDPKAEPVYAMLAGRTQLVSKTRASMAIGVIYVGELTTGRIVAYGFPYNDTNKPLDPIEMAPLDTFPFREKI